MWGAKSSDRNSRQKMGPVQTLHFSDTPAVDMTSEQTAFSSSVVPSGEIAQSSGTWANLLKFYSWPNQRVQNPFDLNFFEADTF